MSAPENNLAYWYPILRRATVMTPKTTIIEARDSVAQLVYGEAAPAFEPLVADIRAAAEDFGYPVFLRSGHGSGKHYWKNTCFVRSAEDVPSHVGAIIEWSEAVDMMGLPTRTWAVREFLPLVSSFYAFKDLPVNRERRYFFGDGAVLCHHPYWPEYAIDKHTEEPDWKAKLAALNDEPDDEVAFLTAETEKVARVFREAGEARPWSLDWAQTKDGQWYAIDMAIGAQSYHWDGCPNILVINGPPKSARQQALAALGLREEESIPGLKPNRGPT